MAVLTVVAAGVDGRLDLDTDEAAAAAGGDDFANDGLTLFYVNNAGASTCVVTIDSKVNSNWGTDVNGGGSVLAGDRAIFGFFPRARFNDTNGRVNVTYDQVVSVTVIAVRMKQDGLN